MSEAEPLKRWFQLHYSALFALLLTAGCIALLTQHNWAFSENELDDRLCYGWPMTIKQFPSPVEKWIGKGIGEDSEFNVNFLALTVDSVISLGILLTVTITIEYLARKKYRPVLRIHLSTAVVLMFVAGGLVAINLRVSNSQHLIDVQRRADEADRQAIKEGDYNHYPFTIEQVGTFAEHGWPCSAFFSEGVMARNEYWSVLGTLADGVSALVILILIGAASEWLIRRREGRKL